MSQKKQIPSKKELEKVYFSNKSINKTAKVFQTSTPTIRKWLKHHGIQMFSHKETMEHDGTTKTGTKRKTKEDSHNLLSNKDWLYEQRIYKKLSKESIANNAGCSTMLVNKYLKKHSIPKIRYNESEENVKEILSDKNMLKELYKTKDLQKIAIEIGSTKATVHKAFEKLGIERKSPNSWDRPFVKISKAHQEIVDFIKTQYVGEVLVNNRKYGTEFDILIPEYHFAIEYNGLFYHHEEAGKDKWYHVKKTKIAEENGIRLFHVFEDQWKQNSDVIKSMISNALQCSSDKIYARQTIIQEVPKKEAISFFKDNHLQGHGSAQKIFGLFYKKELVCCISLAKPRFSKTYDWEIIRFASKLNVNVIGGFSKLIKHIRKELRGSIITYSDRTYSAGNLYKNNGFTLIHTNPPGYWYTDKNFSKRFSRTTFTKSQLVNKFGANPKLTEKAIMLALGFKRIWNCGTQTWVLE